MEIAHAAWRHGRDYRVIDGRSDTLLFITGNHLLLKISGDLGARLRERGLGGMTAPEAAEWNRLAEASVLSDVNRRRLASAGFGDGASLAININLTATCNLGCTYCFADGGDYGRIKGRMSSETVDHLFAFIAEHVTASHVVRLEFFGGEPLLNFERIQEICARAEAMRREHGIRFIHRISTNLTVLPRAAVELFSARRFIVSVSIDGDEVTHDRNRPTKGGRGSYARIIAHCTELRAASEDVTMVARMTVVGERPTLADNVRHLWSLNLFDYFQIYPGVVPADKNTIFIPLGRGSASAPATATLTTPPTFMPQLVEFVESYPSLFAADNRFKGALEYERLVDMVVRGTLALSFCSGGRNYFTLSPDDSIMPCHRLVGETRFQVGSGPGGLDGPLDAWRLPVDAHPTCSQCWIRYLCGGGCKQENFIATGSLSEPNPEMCRYQIGLAENVIRMLASQDEAYRARDRGPLDDLFVSCGRPVVASLREGSWVPEPLRYFARV